MPNRHTIPPAKFGWTWIEGEDNDAGNEWAEIGPLSVDNSVEDEICVVTLRNADVSEKKFPGIRKMKQHQAKIVAEALTEYFDRHGFTEGMLYLDALKGARSG